MLLVQTWWTINMSLKTICIGYCISSTVVLLTWLQSPAINRYFWSLNIRHLHSGVIRSRHVSKWPMWSWSTAVLVPFLCHRWCSCAVLWCQGAWRPCLGIGRCSLCSQCRWACIAHTILGPDHQVSVVGSFSLGGIVHLVFPRDSQSQKDHLSCCFGQQGHVWTGHDWNEWRL